MPSTITVADAAQRAGMSEADLRSINNVPPRMLIKAGSTLIVPRSARVQEDVDAVVADTGQLSFQPEIVTRRTMVKAGKNDSVVSIARRYRLSPANVAQWNDVNANHAFKRGFDVVVYLPVRAAAAEHVGSGRHASAAAATAAPSKSSHSSKGSKSTPAPRPAQQATKSSAKPVVQEKHGGTPSKKKR